MTLRTNLRLGQKPQKPFDSQIGSSGYVTPDGHVSFMTVALGFSKKKVGPILYVLLKSTLLFRLMALARGLPNREVLVCDSLGAHFLEGVAPRTP